MAFTAESTAGTGAQAGVDAAPKDRLGPAVPAQWTSGRTPAALPDDGSAFGAYLRAVRSQALLAATIFILIFGIAVVYVAVRSPSYEGTARMLINPLPQTNTAFTGLPLIRDSGDPTTNMQTAATVIDSPAAAQATAATLGAGWTGRKVQNAISVQPEGQSEILDVTATASSASLAERIANAYAAAVLRLRARTLKAAVAQAIATTKQQLAALKDPSGTAASALQDNLNQLSALVSGNDPTVSLTQSAVAPLSSSGPSRSLILLLGLVVALALASGAALLVEQVRTRRILDEDRLLAVMAGPVIGRIPRYRIRAAGPSVIAPVPPAVSEALRAIRIQLDLLPGRHRSILITSASHADGKTTTTVNLAREMANSGAQVVLIDADLRKPDVGNRFNIHPRASLSVALGAPNPAGLALKVPGESQNLKVLAATPDPDFQTLDRVAHTLEHAIEQMLAEVDYVLIDAPPLGEVADILRFIGSVDDVLLVTRIGHTRLGNVEVVRELLDLAGKPPTGHITIGSSPRQPPPYGYYAPPPSAPSRDKTAAGDRPNGRARRPRIGLRNR